MESHTLRELRELAKKLGLPGYSRLAKDELLQRLGKPKAARAAAAKRAGKAKRNPAHESSTTAAAPPAAKAAPASSTTPVRTDVPRPETVQPTHFSTDEERVESAKFRPFSATAPRATPAPDLGEDIDRLPALRESTLCLLPQKPGILHAYWALAEGDGTRRENLRLRLCHGAPQALQIWEEVPIGSATRGHWYFHVPEAVGHEVLIQLGYYDGDTFVIAIRRGIARIPSLYAADRTDRWWWISEEDFRRMYLRAGGMLTGRRLGWAASIGSPSAPPKPDERLGWPGGVSSRPR